MWPFLTFWQLPELGLSTVTSTVWLMAVPLENMALQTHQYIAYIKTPHFWGKGFSIWVVELLKSQPSCQSFYFLLHWFSRESAYYVIVHSVSDDQVTGQVSKLDLKLYYFSSKKIQIYLNERIYWPKKWLFAWPNATLCTLWFYGV